MPLRASAKRRRQAADAAADDEDRLVFPIAHCAFPPRRIVEADRPATSAASRMRRYTRIFGWWPLTSAAASCGSVQEKARQQSAISVAPANATMKSE